MYLRRRNKISEIVIPNEVHCGSGRSCPHFLIERCPQMDRSEMGEDLQTNSAGARYRAVTCSMRRKAYNTM